MERFINKTTLPDGHLLLRDTEEEAWVIIDDAPEATHPDLVRYIDFDTLRSKGGFNVAGFSAPGEIHALLPTFNARGEQAALSINLLTALFLGAKFNINVRIKSAEHGTFELPFIDHITDG